MGAVRLPTMKKMICMFVALIASASAFEYSEQLWRMDHNEPYENYSNDYDEDMQFSMAEAGEKPWFQFPAHLPKKAISAMETSVSSKSKANKKRHVFQKAKEAMGFLKSGYDAMSSKPSRPLPRSKDALKALKAPKEHRKASRRSRHTPHHSKVKERKHAQVHHAMESFDHFYHSVHAHKKKAHNSHAKKAAKRLVAKRLAAHKAAKKAAKKAVKHKHKATKKAAKRFWGGISVSGWVSAAKRLAAHRLKKGFGSVWPSKKAAKRLAAKKAAKRLAAKKAAKRLVAKKAANLLAAKKVARRLAAKKAAKRLAAKKVAKRLAAKKAAKRLAAKKAARRLAAKRVAAHKAAKKAARRLAAKRAAKHRRRLDGQPQGHDVAPFRRDMRAPARQGRGARRQGQAWAHRALKRMDSKKKTAISEGQRSTVTAVATPGSSMHGRQTKSSQEGVEEESKGTQPQPQQAYGNA